jgi:hypothetical protein
MAWRVDAIKTVECITLVTNKKKNASRTQFPSARAGAWCMIMEGVLFGQILGADYVMLGYTSPAHL